MSKKTENKNSTQCPNCGFPTIAIKDSIAKQVIFLVDRCSKCGIVLLKG